MLRFSSLAWLVAACALAATTYAPSAHACGGGMFYAAGEQETVSVSGHSVVVSISKTRTVLWDRISYVGAPKDFAWIMPVSAGAELELASAAWIEAIVGGTTPIVKSPSMECWGSDGSSSSGGCCGSAMDGRGANLADTHGEQGDVTVVHREVVGPYDTVTIKSDVPGAIGKWLGDNGYAIPAAMQPILDDYAAKGLEFLALRLQPGMGVQDMEPVRVIMPGMLTTFPMRMLSAGAKDEVPISLVVLAEGRYEAKGFANATVDATKLSWDFATHASNYSAVRTSTLAGNGGATWLTSFAANGGLINVASTAPTVDPIDVEGNYPEVEVFSLGASTSSSVLADLYFGRGRENGDTGKLCGSEGFGADAQSAGEVVELCADTTMPCSELQAGQVDSRVFACDTLTDLSTALVGMHPKDVWITRLEAELPVTALSQDLTLQPAAAQASLSHVVQAGAYTGDPCTDGAVAARTMGRKSPRRASAPLAVMLLGVGVAIARKRSRRR